MNVAWDLDEPEWFRDMPRPHVVTDDEVATPEPKASKAESGPFVDAEDTAAYMEAFPSPIGDKTAADLRWSAPPPQMADPFLTPEGATILYAKGGTGKGMVACWMVSRLVRNGLTVMVLDYEGHEREWGFRLRGLGLDDEQLRRIHYRAPYADDSWKAQEGPLTTVAALVRDDCKRLGVQYLVIDSYTVATTDGDSMGGQAAAQEYFNALAMIGLPSLTIAHVAGNAGRFPVKPFGSVFVHNLARETWAVEKVGEADADAHDDEYGPKILALELQNMKANDKGKSAPQFVTFSFYANGEIGVTAEGPSSRKLVDLIADALSGARMDRTQIVKAIFDDTGRKVTDEGVRVALKANPRLFTEDRTTRPRKWSLA